SLQVSQRDSLAKSDASTVYSAILDYSADNIGKLPSSGLDIRQYATLNSDASISVYEYGQDYVVPKANSGDILVVLGATCHRSDTPVDQPLFDAASSRSYAVATVLERGSQFYCID